MAAGQGFRAGATSHLPAPPATPCRRTVHPTVVAAFREPQWEAALSDEGMLSGCDADAEPGSDPLSEGGGAARTGLLAGSPGITILVTIRLSALVPCIPPG